MIEVRCPCGVRLELEDQFAGKRGKCPRCGGVLDIPQRSAAAVSESPVHPPARPRATAVHIDDDPFTPPPAAPQPPKPVAVQPAAAKPIRAASSSVRSVPPPITPRVQSHNPLDPPAAVQPRSVTLRAAKNQLPMKAIAIGGGAAALLIVIIALASTMFGSRSTASVTPQPEGESNPEQKLSPGSNVPSVSPPRQPPVAVNVEANSPPLRTPEIASPNSVATTDPPPASVKSPPTRSEPVAIAPRNASQTANQPGTVGLTGLSRQYDDLHCQTIQHQFGIRIPAAAAIIEVNGQRLPLANVAGLQESPAPYLFLPRGKHAVRWRAGEQAVEVEIGADHDSVYRDMRDFFGAGGEIKTAELHSRSARAMDVHSAPYLLNFTGAAYAAGGKWKPAERAFRRSVHVNPAYSPAHLNLAYCLHQQGNAAECQREIQLAEVFNVGNVFGLAKAIRDLRIAVAASQPETIAEIEFLPEVYVSNQTRTEADRRLEALMESMSKYAVRPSERGKIFNNLAIHYSSSGRTELALEHFRSALAAVRSGGQERFDMARKIFANMQAACETAGFEEAAEYASMQQVVRP